MTQVAISSGALTCWPRPILSTTSLGTTTLDATTDYTSVVMKVPKTGTIDVVTIRSGTTTLVGTLSCRIYNIDSVGDPDTASVYGSCTQVDIVNPAASTNHHFSGLACSATQGDTVAIMFWCSVVTSGSIAIFMQTAFNDGALFPYTSQRTSGTGAGTHSSGATIAVAYSGSLSYVTNCHMPGAANSDNLDSDGTIRRAGNRFTVSGPVTISGAWAIIDNDTDTTTFKLYDTDGTTVLRTATLISAARVGSSQGLYIVPFDDGEYTLTANASPYRIVVQTNNTSATAVGMRGYNSCPSLALLDCLDGGQAWYGTTHNGTSWTDYSTDDAVRRYMVGVCLGKWDNGFGRGAPSLNLGIV